VLNGFHSFPQWSPWLQSPGSIQYHYSGPWSGPGAQLNWQDDGGAAGSGSARIATSEPYHRINATLTLGAHIKATTAFDLTPTENGTHVVWRFDTDSGWNPVTRYAGLLLAHRIGEAYETTLKNLQRFSERLPKTDLAGADIQLAQMQPVSIVYVSGKTTTDGRDVGNALDEAYAAVRAFITAHQLKITGAPMAVTRVWDPEHNNYEFDAALPAAWSSLTVPASSPIRLGQTLGGDVVIATYTGPYSGTSKVYDQIKVWLAANSLTATGLTWEQYMNDPANTPDNKLVTKIYTPVKEDQDGR
jgi:effector-binding domain-containing protein